MFIQRLQLIALSLLCGCAATTSSTVSQDVPPPQEPIAPPIVGGLHTQTVQAPTETGLFIEGRSSYNLEPLLQSFAHQSIEAAQQNGLYSFFGTTDVGFIQPQVTDLHKFILPLLAKKVEQSPLRYERWQGEYRLSFNVLDLGFWTERTATSDLEQGTAVAQIGVILVHIPDNQVLMVQKPNLVVRIHKEQPGGKQTLNGLCEESAQQIFMVLSEYWSTMGKKS